MSIMQTQLSYFLVLVSVFIFFDEVQGGYWGQHGKHYSKSVTSCDPGFLCQPRYDCWYRDVQFKGGKEVKCGYTYNWKKKVCCRGSKDTPSSPPFPPFPKPPTGTYPQRPIPNPPAPSIQPYPGSSTRAYPRPPIRVSPQPSPPPAFRVPPRPPIRVSPQPSPPPAFRVPPRPPIRVSPQPSPPSAFRVPFQRPIKVPPPPIETDPPLPIETEPPMPTETELPMPVETEPPIPIETEPPMPVETEPPVPIEIEPPMPIETEPPVPIEAERPMPYETEPPMPMETEPPMGTYSEQPQPIQTEPSMPIECLTTNLPVPDCGQAIPEAGEHGAWPWMVSVMKTDEDGAPYHFCSGFLIDGIHFISGAACFLDGEVENFTAKVGHVDANQGELYAINKITVHEGYTDGLFYDDIALVTLSREVDIPKFNPICLPTPLQNKNLTGSSVTSLGYSEVNKNGDWIGVPLLQMTKTSVISNFKCNEYYKMFADSFPVGITEKSTCTEGGIPICKGAGGGPLMLKNNFRWYAVGFLSFTCACGTCPFPEGYTNIHKYLNWIREKAD